MNDHPRDVDAIEVLRCADCAASDSAALDAVPIDHMPIPTEALAGFPDGVPRLSRINRGRFLKNGLLGFAAVYGASKIPWQTAFETAVAEGAAGPNNCLVMLFLNGGNDGPNTFVPIAPGQYDAYQTLRPTIARSNSIAGRVGWTDMGGAAAGQLGFSNLAGMTIANSAGAANLQALWNANQMALFPSTDYPNPNLSHFTSRDYWFAGLLSKSSTGWLGRWVDAYGSTTNPLQAVSIGSNVSKSIRTARNPVASVPENIGGFGFSVPGASGAVVNQQVGALAGGAAGNPSTQKSRGVYGQTVTVAGQLAAVGQPAVQAAYPANSSLSRRLQLAAALIGAGLGTRIVTIDWGGFDTHGGQIASHDPQLSVLGQALGAFQADLTARGIAGRVATVVFSEFGRRGGENDSAGTDHGIGTPVVVLGEKARGGLGGDVAPMNALDRGSLRATTDFRSIYSSLLTDWMGGDPGLILPGASPLVRSDGGTLFNP